MLEANRFILVMEGNNQEQEELFGREFHNAQPAHRDEKPSGAVPQAGDSDPRGAELTHRLRSMDLVEVFSPSRVGKDA